MTKLRSAVQKKAGIPLLGAACYQYNPTFLEMSALMGFEVAWIEMEHTFLTFSQAADLCRIGSGLGMLTMIRIAEATRENVLKAAECGPDIIDLPMANDPSIIDSFVRFGRFPPIGERGYFALSRSIGYSLPGSVATLQQQKNQDLCLMVQIETKEAVNRLDDLCSVPGIDALFIGPGDLSASFGVAGQTGHNLVKDAGRRIIQAARRFDKDVAVFSVPQDYPFWVAEGVDILFGTNDIASMKSGAEASMEAARRAIEEAASQNFTGPSTS